MCTWTNSALTTELDALLAFQQHICKIYNSSFKRSLTKYCTCMSQHEVFCTRFDTLSLEAPSISPLKPANHTDLSQLCTQWPFFNYCMDLVLHILIAKSMGNTLCILQLSILQDFVYVVLDKIWGCFRQNKRSSAYSNKIQPMFS